MTLISKFTRRLLFILALTFATLAVANAAESTDATVARQFALLEIIGPEALSVRNEGGAAQLFGAMGAIAQNTLNASNGEALTKLSQDLLPQLAKEFAAAFLASAAKAKISVAYLADQPNPPEIRGQKVLYDKEIGRAHV